MKNKSVNYVYLIRCINNSLYGGYTTDYKRRYQEHVEGKGAKYTKVFKPQSLAVVWRVEGSKSQAMKVEYFVKKQSKSTKEIMCQKPETLFSLVEKKFGQEIKVELEYKV